MIAFQINMTFGHYTEEYLRKWLKILADNSYDTILWEVEDAVRWNTCPESASADAFSKSEFRKILDYAESLGLKSIPLLQSFSHCEYVLRHKEYYHLSEHPEFAELYCPLNPEVKDFLMRWIAEYLEVFEGSEYFHLGGDEAWALGGKYCDGDCPEYMKTHSKSELYIQHLVALCEPLLKAGITPGVWADMLLKHGEAIELLTRDIILFDWQYELRRDVDKVWIWEEPEGLTAPGDIPENLKRKYAKYLPDTFYTSDYLRDKGFKVIGCAASSSSKDNVFAPRTELHLKNTAGWMNKYLSGINNGFMLTSWTVHLFPYEMQLPEIMLPGFMKNNPQASLEDFKLIFCKKIFGIENTEFFDAIELLDKNCLFSHTSTLGFNSYHRKVPDDHVKKYLEKIDCAMELENCRSRLPEYRNALNKLEALRQDTDHSLLELWILQAKNLINRASVSIAILTGKFDIPEILEEMELLCEETGKVYKDKLKKARIEDVVYWQFNSIKKYFKK